MKNMKMKEKDTKKLKHRSNKEDMNVTHQYGMSYTNNTDLERHMENIHGQNCGKYKKKGRLIIPLKRHIGKHHREAEQSNSHTCYKCGKHVKRTANVKIHKEKVHYIKYPEYVEKQYIEYPEKFKTALKRHNWGHKVVVYSCLITKHTGKYLTGND